MKDTWSRNRSLDIGLYFAAICLAVLGAYLTPGLVGGVLLGASVILAQLSRRYHERRQREEL
jgi:energy-converting hydrogenase Eha subunit G